MNKPSPLRTLLCLVLAAMPAVVLADPPDNDDFGNATDLGAVLTVSTQGTLEEATGEDGEPFLDGFFDGEFFYPSEVSIWWTWTCPATTASRLVTISTKTSNWTYLDYDPETFEEVSVTDALDTTLHVFTGDTLAELTPVAESRDGFADGTSRVAFIATAGTTYRIRVSVDDYVSWSEASVAKLALGTQGAPVTADDHVAWGKAKLLHTGGWEEYETPFFGAAVLDAAAAHFQTARTLSKNHPEANALGALIDLLKLQKEEAFATLLTQVGVQDASAYPDFPDYYLPEDVDGNPLFADGALTTHGIEYFKGPVRARLNAALAALEKVTSTTFLGDFPDYTRIIEETVLIDYGDVVLLRGGCKVLLALIDLLETFNLAASLEDIVELDSTGQLQAENLTRTFGNLLQFSGSDKRASVKSNLQAAIALYNQGRTHIRTKRPLSRDEEHLFPLRNMDAEEDTDIKSTLDKISKSLGGTTITEEGWSVNLGKLLSGTLSLRDLAPNFKGDQVIKGSIGNPTFNGALPGTTVLALENELREDDALYEGFLNVEVMKAPGDETFGNVTGGGAFLAGEIVNPGLTATPVEGYVFAKWQLDQLAISPVSPYIFPVIRDYTLVAHFAQDLGDRDMDGLSNNAEVQLGIFDLNDKDSDDDGWPDGLDEQPTVADARQFSVSQNFGDVPLALSSGSITAISKLPPGVTFDAKNRRFVGRPNAIQGAVQTFTAIATVKPATGANFTLNLVFTVEALPPAMVGVFNGLVLPDPNLNGDMGGSVSAMITSAGLVTGKIVLAGKSTSFGPVRLNRLPGEDTASVTVPPIKRAGLPLPAANLDLAFTVSSDGVLQGTADDSVTPVPVDFMARRAHWSGGNKALAYTGVYNAALVPDSSVLDDMSYPHGTGFATLKITDTGTATWGGKLADGTAITGGTTLASAGEVAFHLMLYKNTGSAQGWVEIVGGDVDSVDVIEWVKKDQGIASTSRNYKGGFFKHGLSLQGRRYAQPASLFANLALDAGAGNATVQFGQTGGIVNISQAFTVTAPNAIVMPGNANGVKVTVAAATGLISGGFTVPGPPVQKGTLIGLVVPRLSQGVGFVLVPETALATSPLRSEPVEIADTP